MSQTVEQFLVEQLEKVAPGKYTLASVLQQFKAKLRFPCTHLKGGKSPRSLAGLGKDYNLSIFTFPTGVTEIKCLSNCGLKIRSDEKELTAAFNELYDCPSSNHPASAENVWLVKDGERIPVDPGPAPVYSDAYRQRIKESADLFWASIQIGLATGRIKPNNPILGAVLPHPDPIEAPDTIVERGIKNAFTRVKKNGFLKATVVVQDSIPALDPVKSNKKIRKARKTNPAKRGG
jgi:hypothetical protein